VTGHAHSASATTSRRGLSATGANRKRRSRIVSPTIRVCLNTFPLKVDYNGLSCITYQDFHFIILKLRSY